MCGITGVFELRGRGDIDRVLLRRMTDVIAHRGPDGDGFHYAPGLGLGHRRLAIIDLATGDQPLFNEDGTVCVTFNGEIYNFQRAGRPSLRRSATRFRTRCDTEVIVHAWEEWGEDCRRALQRDVRVRALGRSRETLFLARDRFGEKPLYYTVSRTSGDSCSRSELKSLLLSPDMTRRLDPHGDRRFFRLWLYTRAAIDLCGIAQARRPAHSLLTRTRRAVPRAALLLGFAFCRWRRRRAEDEVAEELIERLRECRPACG